MLFLCIGIKLFQCCFDGQEQEHKKDGKKCGFEESITSGFAAFKVGRQRNVEVLARSKIKTDVRVGLKFKLMQVNKILRKIFYARMIIDTGCLRFYLCQILAKNNLALR